MSTNTSQLKQVVSLNRSDIRNRALLVVPAAYGFSKMQQHEIVSLIQLLKHEDRDLYKYEHPEAVSPIQLTTSIRC